MPDVHSTYAEWQQLCEEHDAARSEYLAAFAAVNSTFVAIANRVSNANPTHEELTKFDTTWNTWQEVKDRMSTFVKTHA